MVLMIHPSSSSPSFTTIKSHLLFHTPGHPKPTKFFIKSQEDSSTGETTSGSGPSPKKPEVSSPGLGFGSSGAASTAAPTKKKQPKRKRERASVIRREPLEKPRFITPEEAARAEELRKNESAFLLAWLGLGAIILLEGIALAASALATLEQQFCYSYSHGGPGFELYDENTFTDTVALSFSSGFLPEAWDKFFVKYLYPSFTPTVFLFVAGTVAYGVLKYMENERSDREN